MYIEDYCGDLEDFLEDNSEVDINNLEWVVAGVSVYTERLARALEFSLNSSHPQIRPIWAKLLFLSRWVLKHPESVDFEASRERRY